MLNLVGVGIGFLNLLSNSGWSLSTESLSPASIFNYVDVAYE